MDLTNARNNHLNVSQLSCFYTVTEERIGALVARLSFVQVNAFVREGETGAKFDTSSYFAVSFCVLVNNVFDRRCFARQVLAMEGLGKYLFALL